MFRKNSSPTIKYPKSLIVQIALTAIWEETCLSIENNDWQNEKISDTFVPLIHFQYKYNYQIPICLYFQLTYVLICNIFNTYVYFENKIERE